jgi:hypothetical protein
MPVGAVRFARYLAVALFALACARSAPDSAGVFTVGDALDLRATFDTLSSHLERRDANAALAMYDTSIAFAHAFDGTVVRGRSGFDRFVRGLFDSVSGIEEAAIDSVVITPAGKDAAVVAAVFRFTAVDGFGARTTRAGAWSNLFVRRPGGWRVIYGHTSRAIVSMRE